MECRVHKLVADVALVADGRVALVKYADTSRYDRQRGWFLPDDFLDHLEHPEDAARRIVRQQLRTDAPPLRLAEIESFGNGAWHLVFHYRADLDAPMTATAGDNVAALEWYLLDALPPEEEMAHHGWAAEVLARTSA